MPLIHVIDIRLDPEAVKRPDPSDSKHDFLAYPHLQVPPVQSRRSITNLRRIRLGVGVKHIKRDTSHHCAPYLDLDRLSLKGDLHRDGTAVFIAKEINRKVGKVVFKVLLLLPAVCIEILAKVSFLIK